jgi:hypothetical protein
MRDAGFDRFQVHFRHDLPIEEIEAWSKAVGAGNLWLAPKLAARRRRPRRVARAGAVHPPGHL